MNELFAYLIEGLFKIAEAFGVIDGPTLTHEQTVAGVGNISGGSWQLILGAIVILALFRMMGNKKPAKGKRR